jgi:pyruvate dehydrogenase E2 component (dihydrolipoamide acetyltransferase)
MAEIVMPRLSDTMEEGTILRWLKRDGEHVTRGEELVEIETDKANMTYESDQEGALEIVAAEGTTLAVGEVIAHVGGDTAATQKRAATGANGALGAADDANEARKGGAAGASPVAAGRDASATAQRADGERIKASPLARRLAGERGLDLHRVSGSGPGGRIVKADVERLATDAPEGAPAPATAQSEALAEVTTAKGETSTIELSRTQQTIARRMAESKATIPDFALQIDVDMEECVKLRTELKRLAKPTGNAEERRTPTFNDMVVKACALALREHPAANGSYRDGRLQVHGRVNVGVAVAAENSLVVPTVFDADEKSLGEIGREAHTLAERVRSGEITPPELGGGTFTVSNLGMFGVKSFTAIINPPQTAILAVGAVEQRAVVRDGEILPRHVMTITLVCDHRVLYGAEAAQFLARVRELLQAPTSLSL